MTAKRDFIGPKNLQAAWLSKNLVGFESQKI